MSDMILVYVVCENEKEAKEIGKKILLKKLAACVNILDKMKSMYFWPPDSGQSPFPKGKGLNREDQGQLVD